MNVWDPETGTVYREFTGVSITPGPPPEPPQYPLSTNMNRIFKRLKWSILDPPSDIEIFSLDAEDKPQWTPFLSDPLLDESATNPPQSQLKILIEPLHTWEHWAQSDTKHLRPAPLSIENIDSQTISIRQYIQAVHEYAVPIRRLLCRCCDIRGSENEAKARFYYDLTMGGSRALTPERPCPELWLFVMEDTHEHGMDDLLQGVEIRYRKQLAST